MALVAVFGASGRTGRRVVEQGLARGHGITAFVRDPGRFEPRHERLRAVRGDARDPQAVEMAIAGQEAVVSTLALMSPEPSTEHSDATRTIVQAMERMGPRRLLVTANTEVFSDRPVDPEYAAFADEHRRNLRTLRGSGLDWTVGAAPWITDDPGVGAYQPVVDGKPPGRSLPRDDFATFVLDALDRQDWIGKVIGLSAPAST